MLSYKDIIEELSNLNYLACLKKAQQDTEGKAPILLNIPADTIGNPHELLVSQNGSDDPSIYAVKERFSYGDDGGVYQALDIKTGTEVVIKRVSYHVSEPKINFERNRQTGVELAKDKLSHNTGFIKVLSHGFTLRCGLESDSNYTFRDGPNRDKLNGVSVLEKGVPFHLCEPKSAADLFHLCMEFYDNLVDANRLGIGLADFSDRNTVFSQDCKTAKVCDYHSNVFSGATLHQPKLPIFSVILKLRYPVYEYEYEEIIDKTLSDSYKAAWAEIRQFLVTDYWEKVCREEGPYNREEARNIFEINVRNAIHKFEIIKREANQTLADRMSHSIQQAAIHGVLRGLGNTATVLLQELGCSQMRAWLGGQTCYYLSYFTQRYAQHNQFSDFPLESLDAAKQALGETAQLLAVETTIGIGQHLCRWMEKKTKQSGWRKTSWCTRQTEKLLSLSVFGYQAREQGALPALAGMAVGGMTQKIIEDVHKPF